MVPRMPRFPTQPDGDGRLLQIGDVARRVGLSLRTVRYYEEIGLIAPSARSDGGFRLYSDADVDRLLLLKPMKALSLSLDEIRELAALMDRGARAAGLPEDELQELVESLGEYATRADDAIAALERQLANAQQLRLRLEERLARCEGILEQRVAGVVAGE
jgi:MerR family transcriptional regulator, copper efflux regulator